MENLFPIRIYGEGNVFVPKALWLIFWGSFVHSVIAFMLAFGGALGILLAIKLVK